MISTSQNLPHPCVCGGGSAREESPLDKLNNNDADDPQWISCVPSILKFAYDKPGEQLATITVWNKSKDFLELVILPPKNPSVFTVFCDKVGLFGGTVATIHVKCNGQNRRMCGETLEVGVAGRDADVVKKVPLELYPSFEWFSLPKIVNLPFVSIGNAADVVIGLPDVPHPEEFFISIKSPYSDALTVTPTTGTLGGSFGVKELVIRYAPKEYITIVYVLQIHFPSVDPTPHLVTLIARTTPSGHLDELRQQVWAMERVMPKIRPLKVPEPPLHFKKVLDDDYVLEAPLHEGEEDLTTPAGVVHFLLRKGGMLHEHAKTIGPLGYSEAEEQHIYNAKEKKFHDELVRERIHQENIPNQNNKAYLGQEPINTRRNFVNRIINERDQQLLQYERALGLVDNPEDLRRSKLKVSNQRSLRRANEAFVDKPNLDNKEIMELNESGRNLAREMALHRFRQIVFLLMVRYRVQKRIPKLHILREKIHAERLAEEELAKEEELARQQEKRHSSLRSSLGEARLSDPPQLRHSLRNSLRKDSGDIIHTIHTTTTTAVPRGSRSVTPTLVDLEINEQMKAEQRRSKSKSKELEFSQLRMDPPANLNNDLPM